MNEAGAAERARATWAAGDYDAVAAHIRGAAEDVVARVGVGAGERVLDVGCGSGNATIPAARSGARATGLDLTPELLEVARRHAREAGVEVEWVEGDAEQLPFADASFDVVVSVFGCMFAPDHRRAAAEIARVLRPGGRIGLAAWTPEGSIGDFFASLAPLAPPPPPGAEPPPLWGTRAHVEELFAGTGVEPRFERGEVVLEFGSVEDAVDHYYDAFGPIVVLRSRLEPEGRGDEIRAAIRGVFERWNARDDERLALPCEYLIALGHKREAGDR